MKKMLFFLLSLWMAIVLQAQPKQEIRAVWLTTNPNAVDWPTSKNETNQKSSLIEILDKLQAANFNTILFQVQSYGDVLWDSGIQPWSYHLTGTPGKAPNYDICAFAIEECHKRNMEIHAWVVPYRVGSNSYVTKYDDCALPHVYKVHPEMCVNYDNAWYLDPGLPEVRKYLVDLYETLVTKYEFDGINLDYTRYPHANFDDGDSFKKYGGGANRDDWRRENINKFVYELYDMIKSHNPGMKLGVAPIGCYKRIPGYSGWYAYSDVFQDPCDWAEKGKIDLIIPQLYWDENSGYSAHTKTWIDNCNGRQLVAGLAAYKMTESPYWQTSVVIDQIEKMRKNNPATCGVSFFRTNYILGENAKIKDLYNQLKDNYFKYPAHIPVMPYNGVTKPDAPVNVKASVNTSTKESTISWDVPEQDENNTSIRYYSVYISESPDIEIDNVENQVAHIVKENTFTYTLPDDKIYYFAVTAFDKGYYESGLSNVVKVSASAGLMDADIKPVRFIVEGDWLRIDTQETVVSVHIYALSGTLMAHGDISEINIGHLSRGAYIVVVTVNNGKIIKYKMIK